MLSHLRAFAHITAFPLLASFLVEITGASRVVIGVDPGTGAIIASTIAAVTLLATTTVTQILQFRRDGRLAREQHSREQAEQQRASSAIRRARLQAGFASVLLSARAYDFAAQRLFEGARPGESNNEARLKALGENVNASQREIDVTLVALRLDGTSSEILAGYTELCEAYTQVLFRYNMDSSHRNGQPRPDLADLAQQIHTAQERLAEAMRATLADLDGNSVA